MNVMPFMNPAPAITPEVALGVLVTRVAREMRIAAAIADDCQDALGDHAATSPFDPATLMRLQSRDLLSQHLVEIGRMLDRLAQTVDGATPNDLLEDVRLSDLRARLSGACIAPFAETDLW